MPDLDLDAAASSITLKKGGKTYTLTPNVLSANEAQRYFDAKPEDADDRFQRSKALIAEGLSQFHKGITADKVGELFSYGEIFQVMRLLLVPPGPAVATPPTTRTRVTRKNSPQKIAGR